MTLPALWQPDCDRNTLLRGGAFPGEQQKNRLPPSLPLKRQSCWTIYALLMKDIVKLCQVIKRNWTDVAWEAARRATNTISKFTGALQSLVNLYVQYYELYSSNSFNVTLQGRLPTLRLFSPLSKSYFLALNFFFLYIKHSLFYDPWMYFIVSSHAPTFKMSLSLVGSFLYDANNCYK